MTSFFRKLFGKSEPQADEAGRRAAEPISDVAAAPVTADTSGANVEGMSDAAVLERARNDIALKTSVHDGSWQLGQAAWDVDLSAGTITFTNKDHVKAVAPVQVIGTLDASAGTWMWGWDHPSVPPECAKDAEVVRQYGEKRGIAELTTRVIPCDVTTAWDYTALACLLASAQGGYRGDAGSTQVFMTFGNVTLSKA